MAGGVGERDAALVTIMCPTSTRPTAQGSVDRLVVLRGLTDRVLGLVLRELTDRVRRVSFTWIDG